MNEKNYNSGIYAVGVLAEQIYSKRKTSLSLPKLREELIKTLGRETIEMIGNARANGLKKLKIKSSFEDLAKRIKSGELPTKAQIAGAILDAGSFTFSDKVTAVKEGLKESAVKGIDILGGTIKKIIWIGVAFLAIYLFIKYAPKRA